MFFGGICSERRLVGTASLNLAHRWYLGYALDEPLPDHSSLTRMFGRLGFAVFRGDGIPEGTAFRRRRPVARPDAAWGGEPRAVCYLLPAHNSGVAEPRRERKHPGPVEARPLR